MAINSVEDATKYINSIRNHLDEMGRESTKAGIYSHASVWYAINAAFCHSAEEVQIIVNLIGKYLEESLERYAFPIENKQSNPFDDFDQLEG